MKVERYLENTIFWSRWLQAPLYLGLIVAQGVYVYHFFLELWHLDHASSTTLSEPGNHARRAGPDRRGDDREPADHGHHRRLRDVRLAAAISTIIRTSRSGFSHVNAGVLKVKLATALIGISSIHLLKTFIERGRRVTDNA